MNLFILLLSTLLQAAPHPTTASSSLNQLSTSQVFAQMGFRLNDIPSYWVWSDRQLEKTQIDLKYQTARLSFSLEETASVVDLELFVKKYLRDYHQFGFDIIGQQALKNSKKTVSIVLDLQQKTNKTKSRQVFFQNGKKIVTATCVDQVETADRSLEECRRVLNSFYWVN
jgi:hypothetical protein